MAAQTFAQAVVKQLAAWGVKFIYGVTGDDILPFLDAIARDSEIKYIGAASEAGAAFMACAQAKLTGELALCTASSAGSVNLLQGLAGAWLDKLPVLAITGQTETAKLGTPTKQYYNHQHVYAEFTAYSQQVSNGSAGLRQLIIAMSKALQSGLPTQLSIPKDIWQQKVQAAPGSKPVLLMNRGKRYPHIIGGTGESAEDASAVMYKLGNSRKPIIVSGRLGQDCRQELVEFADLWGAGIIIAQDAKGVLPDSLSRVLGGIGEAFVPPALQNCDCILLIGSGSFEEKFLPKVPIIQVETKLSRVNDKYLWDALVGESKLILSLLKESLAGYQPNKAWQDELKHSKNLLAEEIKKLSTSVSVLHPAQFMAKLSEVVSDEAIISHDVGAFIHWFDFAFQAKKQEVLMSPMWRSMGNGLPGAAAASLIRENTQVLAIVGDGGLLMSLGELATITKYKLPVAVVVISNQTYGLEKDKTLAGGLTPEGLEIAKADYASIGEAFGCRSFRIDKPEQIIPTLKEALGLKVPVLIEVDCANVRLPLLKG